MLITSVLNLEPFCSLFQLVAEEGGFDVVCKERKWTKIATRMGFAPGKAVGSHIRAHYERILYPYNLFQSGASLLVSCAVSSVLPRQSQSANSMAEESFQGPHFMRCSMQLVTCGLWWRSNPCREPQHSLQPRVML